MRSITQEEAQEIIDPYLEKIRRAVIESVNQYFSGEEYKNVKHRHSLRTHASICHDLIVDSIKKEFEDVPKTSFKNRRGLFMLVIDGMVLLRFKKFNKKMKSVGIVTQQALAFQNQKPEQIELPDMPPDGLLHVGYRLNRLKTSIEGVYITCRKGNGNLWVWDVSAADMKVVENVHQIPQDAIEERPKRTAKAKDSNIVGDQNAGNK